MTGATIVIDDASAADTMRSVKERVFAANYRLPVRRQRLMYRPGPRGIEPLADDDTLGGAGVAQDGTAVIDMLLADLTAAEQTELDQKVLFLLSRRRKWLYASNYCNAHLRFITSRGPAFFAEHQLFQAAQQGLAGDLLALISDGASVDAESNVRETCCSHCHDLVSFGLDVL
jgi:hypothetical protein